MIELITGTPGAGKTLMTVGRVLRPLVGSKVKDEHGIEHERRLCIGGIPDLLLPHESVSVQTYDPERGGEPSDGRERRPGSPPLDDVEMAAHNWWQWCRPGDVIVIDECQRLFRPMASGRKVPLFIAMLETHRHYGIDIVLITQHPQLIHANVRALVGKHRDVRRLFGGFQRMVYEWDRCSNVERRKDATAVPWRPDKSVYRLYKSSEIHTKQTFSIPLPLIVAGLVVFGLPAALWFAYNRVTGAFSGERVRSPAAVAAPGPSPAVYAPPAAGPAAPVPAAFPVPDAPASDPPAAPRLKLSGCISFAARCSCFDADGYAVELEQAVCRRAAREYGKEIPYPVTENRPAASSPAALAAPAPAVDG